ncbi:helix-turn-helix domain-containing protein [Nocardiopsis sp. MG754419]|uniref:helix-turn-helix domain-containing protein n=1 Tax=Nocardiopsis sp. MG754419 TaxID=2259865 RepID=UPI001BA91028|nr:helix-turn-helix transcriptional regulator [Nocardiopsis sp. MG754419]MBR8743655.1 XRE family transcriptional regulator [Nocardiopsis sp. MG754419]
MSESVLRSLDEARRGPVREERAAEPLMRDLIGDLLRRTRVDQGRTLREVAEDAQVSLPYLSEIERGRKEASSEVLAAVYRSLGLSITDVLGALHRRTTLFRLERADPRRSGTVTTPAPPAHQARVLSLAA